MIYLISAESAALIIAAFVLPSMTIACAPSISSRVEANSVTGTLPRVWSFSSRIKAAPSPTISSFSSFKCEVSFGICFLGALRLGLSDRFVTVLEVLVVRVALGFESFDLPLRA